MKLDKSSLNSYTLFNQISLKDFITFKTLTQLKFFSKETFVNMTRAKVFITVLQCRIYTH